MPMSAFFEKLRCHKQDEENQGRMKMLYSQQEQLKRAERAYAILDERDRQDDIWGTQEHTLDEWMTILDKWKGKLAAEIIEGWQEPNENWRRRAIQVAAIALTMVEQTPEVE